MSELEFELTVDLSQLEQLPDMGRQAMSRAVQLMATEVWGNIARESPVNEGRLAGSWQLTETGDLEWTIGTEVRYASFVHEGTGIHGPAGARITPVSAQVLAFQWMGELWFLKSVAGQEPNPFADRAVARAETRAEDFAQIAIAEVFG